MVNVIPLENILSLVIFLGLSYPTHFLKIADSGIGDNFLEYSLKQVNIMHDESFLKHFSLQRKQSVYSIGTYIAPEGTQFLVKCIKNSKKSHF